MDMVCIWICCVYGYVMHMDMLCIWICYAYGYVMGRKIIEIPLDNKGFWWSWGGMHRAALSMGMKIIEIQ